jgi:hypothetical protein
MHRFEYCALTDLRKAIPPLDRYGSTPRLIPGGTDMFTAPPSRSSRIWDEKTDARQNCD